MFVYTYSGLSETSTKNGAQLHLFVLEAGILLSKEAAGSAYIIDWQHRRDHPPSFRLLNVALLVSSIGFLWKKVLEELRRKFKLFNSSMMIPNKKTVAIVFVILLTVVPFWVSARPQSFDLPLPAFENQPGDRGPTPTRAPEAAIPDEIIETCTPDCTASHCTVECKCAYTHRAVTAKCSPPKDSSLATLCQSWFQMCPEFNQVNYNGK